MDVPQPPSPVCVKIHEFTPPPPPTLLLSFYHRSSSSTPSLLLWCAFPQRGALRRPSLLQRCNTTLTCILISSPPSPAVEHFGGSLKEITSEWFSSLQLYLMVSVTAVQATVLIVAPCYCQWMDAQLGATINHHLHHHHHH